MFKLFRPRQKFPQRLLVLMGVPTEKNTFDEISEASDFLNGFCEDKSSKEKWEAYKETANMMKDFARFVDKHGGKVKAFRQPEDLNDIVDYDSVIVIAHHKYESHEIELLGRLYKTSAIIENIPEDFGGDIDLVVCTSTNLIPLIKERCHDRPHVVAPKKETSLRLRLLLTQEVLKKWIEEKDSYIHAFESTISRLQRNTSPSNSGQKSKDAIYLGNELISSVFAPKEAEKGQTFVVQLHIHKDSDSTVVIEKAKIIDDQTRLAQQKQLNLKLKKNDFIEVRLSNTNGEKVLIDGKKLKQKKKSVTWYNSATSIEFAVVVPKDSMSDRFVGQILVCVNKLPALEMLFATNLVSKSGNLRDCADFSIIPFDLQKEMGEESARLRNIISERLDRISQISKESIDENRRDSLINEKELCENLLTLLDKKPQLKDNRVLKVFVSSTSDMKKYRKIAEEQIRNCSMFAEMYEYWPQAEGTPINICCEKVMESDIFCCILGSSYGYLEPTWKMSMTGMEYYTALATGIPVLVYIMSDLEKDIDLTKETDDSFIAQMNLINDIKKRRMVEFFADENQLALSQRGEFSLLKIGIESGIKDLRDFKVIKNSK